MCDMTVSTRIGDGLRHEYTRSILRKPCLHILQSATWMFHCCFTAREIYTLHCQHSQHTHNTHTHNTPYLCLSLFLLRYLVRTNLVPPMFAEVAASIDGVLQGAGGNITEGKEGGEVRLDSPSDLLTSAATRGRELTPTGQNRIGVHFNTLLYVHEQTIEPTTVATSATDGTGGGDATGVTGGGGGGGGASGGAGPGGVWESRVLNPDVDWLAVEESYLNNDPSLVSFDHFFTPLALKHLYEYALASTVWFHHKPSYVGAYYQDGLLSPVLRETVVELRRRLPRILGGLDLMHLWMYNYAQGLQTGTGVHADVATVNINVWLTPDEANLGSFGTRDAGGLIVYSKPPPANFAMNRDTNNFRAGGLIYDFLKESGSKATEVAFRQNRAVLFQSDLFHESARFTFKPGFRNRRINLTLLFGKNAFLPDDLPGGTGSRTGPGRTGPGRTGSEAA